MFVLQELWRGNITPSERFVRSGSEYKKIAGKLSDEMDRLMEMISPEAKVQKEIVGDVSEVFQNFNLQDIHIQGVLGLFKKLVDVLFVVVQGSLTDFLSLFQGKKFIATSAKVRSSQTIFIRIFYTSQIRETVGSEAFFAFLEIRDLNF